MELPPPLNTNSIWQPVDHTENNWFSVIYEKQGDLAAVTYHNVKVDILSNVLCDAQARFDDVYARRWDVPLQTYRSQLTFTRSSLTVSILRVSATRDGRCVIND